MQGGKDRGFGDRRFRDRGFRVLEMRALGSAYVLPPCMWSALEF